MLTVYPKAFSCVGRGILKNHEVSKIDLVVGVVIEVTGYGCKVVGPRVCDCSSQGSVYCAHREVGLK